MKINISICNDYDVQIFNETVENEEEAKRLIDEFCYEYEAFLDAVTYDDYK